MVKTLVCTVEEETILNYLFIKEMLESGDSVLLIAQQKFSGYVAKFRQLFPGVTIDAIVLEHDGDEDLWDLICRTIRSKLSQDVSYAVNLSSGTRLMSIAVQQVFERFDSQFYFMPNDRNVIIHSQIDDNNENNDDLLVEIKHRVTVKEYLMVNGIRCTSHTPTQPKEYTDHFLSLFTQNMLSGREYGILESLRKLSDVDFVDYCRVSGLENFVQYIGFVPKNSGGLTDEEVKYLTGGWFEESIYHSVKAMIAPDDIAVGVVIQRTENRNRDINELDVVFTHKNRLFVIECKTGVGRAGLYHEIVYKACALRESLLAMRSNAYIFSLNEDPQDRLKITARNMGIVYCDRSYALAPSKLKNLFLNPKMYL